MRLSWAGYAARTRELKTHTKLYSIILMVVKYVGEAVYNEITLIWILIKLETSPSCDVSFRHRQLYPEESVHVTHWIEDLWCGLNGMVGRYISASESNLCCILS
jgi:hypothetical protein